MVRFLDSARNSSHGAAAEAHGQLITGRKLVVMETDCLGVTLSPIRYCRSGAVTIGDVVTLVVRSSVSLEPLPARFQQPPNLTDSRSA